MISVIVPTNRPGGLDVLFDSLAQQTYKDFELIVVDALWGLRVDLVDDEAKPSGVHWTWPALSEKARHGCDLKQAYCHSVNTGIANASGETIVLLCDYSWLHPDCLATHAAIQAKTPGPVHLDYNYCALPPLKPGLPDYSQSHLPDGEREAKLAEDTARYVADLRSGKLNPFMWSIFEEHLTEEAVKALPVTLKHRPCATRERGDWNWCSFKNESFPTELFLEMNGLDEAYDESHCYQDLEFSYRLRERGIEWINGPPETGMVTVVNPRDIINIKQLGKPIAHNKRLCELERAAGLRLPVNPGWSLREWRKREVGL